MLTARELRLRGRKVLMLEKGSQAGREASWASAGMVGEPGPGESSPVARLEAESLGLFTALSAELKAETGMDIEYLREGWLSLAWDEAQMAALEKADALASGQGQDSIILGGSELWGMEPALSRDLVTRSASEYA